MANISEKYGDSAIVLGCAEGLGAAFVRELINRKVTNLYLVDYNKPQLQILEESLSSYDHLVVNPYHLDLSHEKAWTTVSDLILNSRIGLVVINAAYSPVSLFSSLSEDDIDSVIDLNIKSATHILHSISKNKLNDRALGVIVMSSLSAYYGGVGIATYAASKAYLMTLGRSLYRELKNENVDIVTCCPGMVDTPGFRKSKPVKSSISISPSSAEEVVYSAINSLGKRAIVIPGRMNKISYLVFNRLLPYSIVHNIVDNVLDRMYNLRKR